jgi:hypothetical protein
MPKSVRERYQTDPLFKNLVQSMLHFVHTGQYTPSELREAATLASIIYMETYGQPQVLIKSLAIHNFLNSQEFCPTSHPLEDYSGPEETIKLAGGSSPVR